MAQSTASRAGRNQLLPLLCAECFIKLACVILNLLYALTQIDGGAARSRRGIIELMGKPGRHRAKLDWSERVHLADRSKGLFEKDAS